MSAIDRQIWDRLSSYGYEPHHVAGIMGNLMQESGLRPGVENGIGAYGLAQWLGPRREALNRFASNRGTDPSDPETQIDFMASELNGPERRAAAALRAARTPGEAAAIFRRAYERPGEAEANDPRRISAANDFFSRLNPISTASANESPSGPGVMWDPLANGWEVDTPAVDQAAESDMRAQMDSEQWDPLANGWEVDDSPTAASEQIQPRQMQAFPEVSGGVGDFISGLGSSIARQGSGVLGGLQQLENAVTGGNAPSASLLSPEKMRLLSATLERNTDTGKLGAVLGDVAPFMAMGPAAGVAYAGASTPGGIEDRLGASAGAAAGNMLGAGLSRAVRGFTPSLAAQTLMREGVQPTLGQGIEQGVMGRAIRRGEEATTSLPLAGATTRAARSRAAEQWTNAVLGRAEGEIIPGINISAGGKQGNEAVLNLRKSFNNAYDTLLQGQSVPISQQIGGMVDRVIDDTNLFIAPEGREWARKFVINQVNALTPENGVVPANAFKKVADEIGAKGSSMLKSQSAQEVDIGRALMEADDVLSAHLEQSLPPDMRGVMSEIDKRYANFKRIQRATVQARDAEGRFTPAELQRAVKMLDTSRDRARFAEGAALLQDLSSAGKAVIPETLGESGTTPRALMADVMKGGAAEAGSAMLGGLPAYATLAGLMYGGSREPIQRAMLGGYGWQKPTSEALQEWLPNVGAGLGAYFGR